MLRAVSDALSRLREGSGRIAGKGLASHFVCDHNAHRMAMMGLIEDVVESWVGLRSPRPQTVFARSGWHPDEPADYCARCGTSVGEGEATETGCGACRKVKNPRFDRVVRLGRYEGPLREWILGVKYDRWEQMGRALGEELGRSIAAVERIDREFAIVVPVPMPWQRRLFRGIDHARVIASGVARALRVDLFQMLSKTNGPAQVSLPATERRTNMRSRLRLRRRIGGWPIDDLHVILVDDVRTSGATLDATGRVMRDLRPMRLTAAVLAVADEAARRGREGVRGAIDREPAQ